MVRPRSLGVLRDMNVMQPDFPVRDQCEPIGKRSTARAQRFHLGTGERDTRLEGVLDRVVVPGPPVRGDDLVSLLACHFSPVGPSRAKLSTGHPPQPTKAKPAGNGG